MSGSAPRSTRAREALELAALVIGREPPSTVDRLRAVGEALAAGGEADPDGLALMERVRARYARELAELERPEPW